MDGQLANEVVDIEVCKVCLKDWTRINQSDVEMSNPLLDSCNSMASSPYDQSSKIAHYDLQFTTVPLSETPLGSDIEESHSHHKKDASLKPNSDTLIASLWDFSDQVIFHNFHSVFISDGGVSIITFNASMDLTDSFVGYPYPPECCTVISSIHYWLQVVNSVCAVKENVLLVGTHIDKLHPNIKKARKIASSKILPVLEEELFRMPYAKHIAYHSEGIKIALKKSCFFVSNKDWDGEIEELKDAAVAVATLLGPEEKPLLMSPKIEQALLQLNKQVISVSTMLDLVAENVFTLDKNNPEFKNILKYFHDNRTIMHFSQIESLKDLVILSPTWLVKLFGYVIAAQSYNAGGEFDWAWKRLTNYGILHECLLQHMLDKFHSDYPVADEVQVTKEQTLDILLHFHLLARIISKAWFAEEGFTQPPETGDTFIVPSLLRLDDQSPPETQQERIIYFMFRRGFIPINLLNQLIAKCICRSVETNDMLLW